MTEIRKPSGANSSARVHEAPHGHSGALLFCTIVFDDPKRALRWVRFYRPRMARMGVTHLLLVDDGSGVAPILDAPFQQVAADEALPTALQHEVTIARFRRRLGRESLSCFPGWWRSFCFSYAFATQFGFACIIHVESDFYLLSDAILEYFRRTRSGWNALWCRAWGFPESALQIIGSDQFATFATLSERLAANLWQNAQLAEHVLPVTHIERSFVGDRFGERAVCLRWGRVPDQLDYIGQVDQPTWAEDDGRIPKQYIDFITHETQRPEPMKAVAVNDAHHAEALYRDLIRQAPEQPAGYEGLGQLALRDERFGDAVAWFREAARRDPERASRFNNLSLACYRAGEFAAAEQAARRAVRLDAGYAAAWNNLGNAYLGQDEPALARAAYREALRHQRAYTKAWLNLARVELRLGSAGAGPVAAVRAARRALRLDAQATQAWHLLAQGEQARRRYPEALAAVEEALKANPDDLDLLRLKGCLLRDTFQPEAAVALLEALGRRWPQDQWVWNELGLTLDSVNRLTEAAAAFDRCIAALAAEGRRIGETRVELSPEAMGNLHMVRFNRTMNFLKQGDFAHGWAEYFHRWNGRDRDFDREFRVPRWQGQTLSGRHVIVATEQGIGDTLQFIRYMDLLIKRARPARITLATLPATAELLKDYRGIDAIILPDQPLPQADCYILLMDLPYWFETRLEDIPADVPYLRIPRKEREPWRRRLARLAPGARVGLAWQGNPGYGQDHFRSYPLRACVPWFELPGIQWVQLQRHTGVEQLAGLELPLQDLGQESLRECAALVAELDLVISPDSMLAHLAGALGREVWVPLCYKGEWRWLTERADSPWYPTLRLFRQTRPGDWSSAMVPLREALAAWLERRA